MDVAVAYNPLLVLLSIVIAVQASYVGLRLTIKVTEANGLRQRLLLVGASLSLAMGIWGMHFVGMLAAELPGDAGYQALPTLISFLLCVLVVGFAIVGMSLWPRSVWTLAGTAVVMGTGIATMHYVGMMALHDSLHMIHDPVFVVASLVAAVLASAAALWLATMARRRPSLIVCAIVLGLAISSMHYIAMAGTTLHRMADVKPAIDPTLSPGLMAVVVAIVAFIISAGFFLTLMPEPHIASSLSEGDEPRQEVGPAASETLAHAGPATVAATPELAAPTVEGASAPTEPGPRPVPVERDGIRIILRPDEIYAVRANAHYCSVYNGREELFCSLSISDVEAHLQGGSFVRVHRSHIVNLDHVAGIRKTADGGFVILARRDRLSIPVSRARINAIRDVVDGRTRATAQHVADRA